MGGILDGQVCDGKFFPILSKVRKIWMEGTASATPIDRWTMAVTSSTGPGLLPERQSLRLHEDGRQEMKMNIEQRRNIVNHKLESIHDTLSSWAKSRCLDHRIVKNLMEGKLSGTRGIPSEARQTMEAFFGKIF